LVFKLLPAPTVAALVIAGATPLAEVSLDGKPLGKVEQDGSFSRSNIQPGRRTVRLRKEGFKLKELQREFVAGESVKLSANEVALESVALPAAPAMAPPRLIVQTVAGAHIIIDGQPYGQTGPNGRLEITTAPPGEHTLEVVANKPYDDYKQKVTLSPGNDTKPKIALLASMPVEHTHRFGSCSGALVVGADRIKYVASGGNDSFDHPLSSVKKVSSEESGKAFSVDIAGAKHFVFRAAEAAEDLKIIQTALAHK